MSQSRPLRIRRNDALEFARLTRNNLDLVQRSVGRDRQAHAVTQLTNSLLGLIVFPAEEEYVREVLANRPLSALGSPLWNITRGAGQTKTLGALLRRLRNAAAHGHLSFSSDDPVMTNVVITARDYALDDTGLPEAQPFWEASIKASDLDQFCRALIRLLENTLL